MKCGLGFGEHAHSVAKEWWNARRRPTELWVLIRQDGQGQVRLARTRSLLFFSTPFIGSDYARTLRVDAHLSAVAASRIPDQVENWTAEGLDSFVLDCCPRCGSGQAIPLGTLRNEQAFGEYWAFTLIVQKERMRQFAGSAFQSLVRRQTAAIVPKLKELRDHVNPGCAAVHCALALLSPFEDEQAREDLLHVSRRRLVELGFEDLAARLPNGTDGLLYGFRLLRQMAEGDFNAHLPPVQSNTTSARTI